MCPISEQFLLSSFREFIHDGYCLDQGLMSSGSCIKEMHAVRRLTDQFDVKSPSDFKILSARKLKTLFQKYKLELTLQVFTLASVKFCINIREFLKDTTMAESHENVVWKSEFTFFQRLYSNFNSLTLSSASELFWSWISINHIQVHENDFCHCLFTDTQNVKLGIFAGSRAVDSNEMYKKAWCTCKVVVLHCHAIAYLTFSSPPHLKLPIIYITSIYLSSRDKHSDQNNCQSLIEATKPQR